MEYSHHSVGIQLADYIARAFLGFLKGYKNSKEIFINRIKPLLQNINGEIMGYGIRSTEK